jgi:hypothetical protein
MQISRRNSYISHSLPAISAQDGGGKNLKAEAPLPNLDSDSDTRLSEERPLQNLVNFVKAGEYCLLESLVHALSQDSADLAKNKNS